ncbi:alpha/beta hydrolase, partial [Streptomyces sp. NPDC006658]
PAHDYRTDAAACPAWQERPRPHRPATLITRGIRDPFLPEPGARACLRDVPDAGLHLFGTGHFTLEARPPGSAR